MLPVILILTILFARLIFPILARHQARKLENFYWKTGPDAGPEGPPAPVDDYDIHRHDKIWL